MPDKDKPSESIHVFGVSRPARDIQINSQQPSKGPLSSVQPARPTTSKLEAAPPKPGPKG